MRKEENAGYQRVTSILCFSYNVFERPFPQGRDKRLETANQMLQK